MKLAINDIAQRFLFLKQEQPLIFSIRKNQQASSAKITYSSKNVTPSFPVMRMCCCTMSY